LNTEDTEGTNEAILEAVKNSCKSRICRENTLDFLESINDVNSKASLILEASITKISGASGFSEETINDFFKDHSVNSDEIKSYIDIRDFISLL